MLTLSQYSLLLIGVESLYHLKYYFYKNSENATELLGVKKLVSNVDLYYSGSG
jgi:hypothetical protein